MQVVGSQALSDVKQDDSGCGLKEAMGEDDTSLTRGGFLF